MSTTTSPEQTLEQRVQELLDKGDRSDRQAFLSLQYDMGLAWVHFPEGFGGLGIAPGNQRIVNDALAAAGAPMGIRGGIGGGMAAPTIAVHGTDEQRRRYLKPLFAGQEHWCQLFSEPGAGSDLASLATRAVRDGDEWIINGQKVWTSGAHLSHRGILVARHDPNAYKHRGLTYFLLDMHAPGVEVRPLRQMTGAAEFNEVYMTDVRVADADRLGDVGNGWAVALATLMNERVSIGGGGGPPARPQAGAGAAAPAVPAAPTRGGEPVRVWKDRGHTDPATRDRVMQHLVASEVARLTNIRSGQTRKQGTPGPDGSLGKLAFADLNKKGTELATDLMGMEGQLYASYDLVDRPGMDRPAEAPPSRDDLLRRSFLRSRANSIEGGTSEVMRNILGERVLGLPGDIRTDKDRPWIEVPR